MSFSTLNSVLFHAWYIYAHYHFPSHIFRGLPGQWNAQCNASFFLFKTTNSFFWILSSVWILNWQTNLCISYFRTISAYTIQMYFKKWVTCRVDAVFSKKSFLKVLKGTFLIVSLILLMFGALIRPSSLYRPWFFIWKIFLIFLSFYHHAPAIFFGRYLLLHLIYIQIVRYFAP